MKRFQLRSAAEQVAAHLREEILRGQWAETLPGVHQLAEELGVNHKTVGAAVRELEVSGLIKSQGAGRNRVVSRPSATGPARSLRIGIILFDNHEDLRDPRIIELRHALAEQEHVVVMAKKSLRDFNMDPRRIAKMVSTKDVNAWIVCSASRDVLEWFAAQPTPAFALSGRQEGVDIAGAKPDGRKNYAEIARRLIELGHKRITLLCRSSRRHPHPGRVERVFLTELVSHGLELSDYNFPDWEDTPHGFQNVLDSLFRVTPPSALVINEAILFNAAAQFIARQGLRCPEDVSMVCTHREETLSWCRPTIAHTDPDTRPNIRRAVKWVNNVSRGIEDKKQTLSSSRFIEGDTLGPASR